MRENSGNRNGVCRYVGAWGVFGSSTLFTNFVNMRPSSMLKKSEVDKIQLRLQNNVDPILSIFEKKLSVENFLASLMMDTD